MGTLNKKIKDLDSLFIYKFKLYDKKTKKIKIYYISPDNMHNYISVDFSPNSDKQYLCELGELYLDEKRKTAFEDTPYETFKILNKEYKHFKTYYDKQFFWFNSKISEIINSCNFNENISYPL